MKNIFKTGKCSIAAILTLCIILGVAGRCVYAASVIPVYIATTHEEKTTHNEKRIVFSNVTEIDRLVL